MSKDYEEIDDLGSSIGNYNAAKDSEEPNEVKWLDNDDKEVDQVFGFNQNAELVNSRAAMIGFIMLILTELAFGGDPVTLSIFGIN
mgnify:CR=1 FL=1